MTDISKQCGELWRGMDDAAKAEHVVAAEADKARYTAEMVNYVPAEEPAATKAAAKKKPAAKKCVWRPAHSCTLLHHRRA